MLSLDLLWPDNNPTSESDALALLYFAWLALALQFREKGNKTGTKSTGMMTSVIIEMDKRITDSQASSHCRDIIASILLFQTRLIE